MKAVNLIPTDSPKGPRQVRAIAGPSGPIGAYVVLAVLAVAVVMAGAWALTGRQLSEKRSEVARVETEAVAAEAKVAALKSYTDFAALRKARVETVAGLLKGRFDWSHSMREVARVIPSDVSLTSFVGTVAPGSSVTGGAGGSSLRGALPVPAVDLIGCAKSQRRVATLLARLRSIDGVQRVTLASSEKADAGSAGGTECRATTQMPLFQLTVFYKAQDGIVPATDATVPAGSAPAATSTTPAAAAAPTAASAGGAK